MEKNGKKADVPARSLQKRRSLRDRTKPERRKPGRPSKYNEQVCTAIFAAVEQGMSPTAAGALHGLHAQTISDWRTQFPEFSEGIEQARARGIRTRLEEVASGVNVAGLKDWKASAWLLERLDREQFGKPGAGAAVNVSVQANAASHVQGGVALTEAELADIQERRVAALKERA